LKSLRRTIIEKIRDRIDKKFGVGKTVKQIFRDVVHGPLTRADVYSRCVVEDAGQSREKPIDNESGDRILKLRLYLQCAADWEKTEEAGDWTDNVELIIGDLQNYSEDGCGILFCDYISDEPFDVVYTNGATEAVWVVDIEVHYFLEETSF